MISTDAPTYTQSQLSSLAHQDVGGLTDPRNPYQNFVANQYGPLTTATIQVHELGHSLFSITTAWSPGVPEPTEEGARLADCIRKKGGFTGK